MTASVFIDGDQGTTGLEIRSRLAGRRDIDLITLPEPLRKDAGARAAAINGCDLAVLCLPDDAARQAVASIRNPRVRVIDASSAHRTAAGWVYGFAEMAPGQAERIAGAARVSNPGCYPTGAIALLRPLVDTGWLHGDAPLVIHAVSGYSGGGRAAIEAHEAQGTPGAACVPAFASYGLGLQHKHLPEIVRHAGLGARPFFLPSYGGYRQGILLTIPLQAALLRRPASAAALRDLLTRRYHGQPTVRVLSAADTEARATLDPQALNGTDDLELAVFGNEAHGQLLLSAVFDNLGKGAAGAAVQNLDLMLGLGAGNTPTARCLEAST